MTSTMSHAMAGLLATGFAAVMMASSGRAQPFVNYASFSGQYACGFTAGGQALTRFTLDAESGAMRWQGLAGTQAAGVAVRWYVPREGRLYYSLLMNLKENIIIRFTAQAHAYRTEIFMPGPYVKLLCQKEA